MEVFGRVSKLVTVVKRGCLMGNIKANIHTVPLDNFYQKKREGQGNGWGS